MTCHDKQPAQPKKNIKYKKKGKKGKQKEGSKKKIKKRTAAPADRKTRVNGEPRSASSSLGPWAGCVPPARPVEWMHSVHPFGWGRERGSERAGKEGQGKKEEGEGFTGN